MLNTMGQARDKIVLAYNGAKIYGTSQTLQQLRIFKDCQIGGCIVIWHLRVARSPAHSRWLLDGRMGGAAAE